MSLFIVCSLALYLFLSLFALSSARLIQRRLLFALVVSTVPKQSLKGHSIFFLWLLLAFDFRLFFSYSIARLSPSFRVLFYPKRAKSTIVSFGALCLEKIQQTPSIPRWHRAAEVKCDKLSWSGDAIDIQRGGPPRYFYVWMTPDMTESISHIRDIFSGRAFQAEKDKLDLIFCKVFSIATFLTHQWIMLSFISTTLLPIL